MLNNVENFDIKKNSNNINNISTPYDIPDNNSKNSRNKESANNQNDSNSNNQRSNNNPGGNSQNNNHLGYSLNLKNKNFTRSQTLSNHTPDKNNNILEENIDDIIQSIEKIENY